MVIFSENPRISFPVNMSPKVDGETRLYKVLPRL